MKCRAVIFDAYGTLFNIHSGILKAGVSIAGDLQSLSTLWRQTQLEYTWLRSLMNRYEDFYALTRAALESAAHQLRIELNEPQLKSLVDGYLCPFVFPDVKPALEQLEGIPRLILSNGTAGMLESAVRHNGLESFFAQILSADRARCYKPSPRVYALGTEILRLRAAEILFVSSNWWDAMGAKAFGYNVCWCNRSSVDISFGEYRPDLIVGNLQEIADHVREP